MGALGDFGAFGFWMFIAAVVVAGVWSDARKRESQQETLRRLVDSGQKIDAALVDKIVDAGGGKTNPAQDLKTGGIIVMFVAPGLTLLGWFLSKFNESVLDVMLGVSALVGLVGVGLYVAGKMSESKGSEDRF